MLWHAVKAAVDRAMRDPVTEPFQAVDEFTEHLLFGELTDVLHCDDIWPDAIHEVRERSEQ